MSRLVLVLALVAGVAWPADISAKPAASSKSKSKTKSAKKSSKNSSKKSSKKSAKKSSKKSSKDKRTASKRRGKPNNRVTTASKRASSRGQHMPKGFVWPPSRAMITAGQHCIAKLDALGIEYKLADREGRIVRAVTVPSMNFGGVQFSSRFKSGSLPMDCQFALALHKIGPILASLDVREVKFGSLFRWTNIRHHGQTKPILSRHALGLAMDIYAFVDTAGNTHVIEKDYRMADPLLLNIEDALNESGALRTLLTPKNDPISHSDHYHIEAVSDFTAPNS